MGGRKLPSNWKRTRNILFTARFPSSVCSCGLILTPDTRKKREFFEARGGGGGAAAGALPCGQL